MITNVQDNDWKAAWLPGEAPGQLSVPAVRERLRVLSQQANGPGQFDRPDIAMSRIALLAPYLVELLDSLS